VQIATRREKFLLGIAERTQKESEFFSMTKTSDAKQPPVSSSRTGKRSSTAKPDAPVKVDAEANDGDPFVVGIGASAGGLQALESFFGSMKDPPHAAFVVVQHLSPDFKSFMVELLTKHTNMPVLRAEQDMPVSARHLYLIPPRTTLTISKGRLQLEKYDPHHGLHLPIDRFFISLAADQQQRAIGIVLSGTGSDGTAGVRAIKDAGGMVMVQSEESAQFDGMPRSAISTGLADYVLPPENMPAQLATYLSHPLLTSKCAFDPRRDGESSLSEIFVLLRAHSGVDFANYKAATVDRRIERRMSVCQIANLADYVRHLRQSTREVSLLFNELLIGVTSFVRDLTAWEALQKEVLPELLKELPANETFRAWVPGCSTGEEAYSLAIVVNETMDKLRLHHSVKIFATDISKESLTIATRGHYSPSEVAGLPSAWLNKYFIKE
jgi:two-component system, chemotaxis family, CheB/CheR fusion protein